MQSICCLLAREKTPRQAVSILGLECGLALTILAMHPHGIIPLQGFLWPALCDQYLHDLYGFGATTDAALRIPLLRQVIGWLSAGSASPYRTARANLRAIQAQPVETTPPSGRDPSTAIAHRAAYAWTQHSFEGGHYKEAGGAAA